MGLAELTRELGPATRVPDDADVLGMCVRCFRMRWLAVVTNPTTPSGCCHTCDQDRP